jgi:hypothetical protein
MNDQSNSVITCPNCGEEVSSKAIACKHCGHLLKDIGNDAMQTMVINRPKLLDDDEFAANFPQGTSKFSDDIIYVSIERLNTPIARYIQDKPLVLGRRELDETSELTSNDIDLTPYNAHERGVSRRHAHIYHADGGLFIEDLGSSNGTVVNGTVLELNQPQKLRDGDEIMLGRMMLWINF